MPKTLSEQAMEMYQRQAYESLKLFKKRKKKSWAALGINNDMLVRVLEIEPTRKPPQRNIEFDLRTLIPLVYKHREIHAVMGTSSHPTIAQMAAIREQEKFRADPRFPLFQIMERVKRYKAIFAGAPYKPIFA